MDVVKELRALQAKPRTLTAQRGMSTETGIFSAHFASERLLRDVVRDSTIDIMHIFLCGWSRYLFSWVADELIPRDVSWDDVNRKKHAHHFPRGVRIPELERSKGDNRASTSFHLNAFEMMHVALARCVSVCLAKHIMS